jgi:hypothetical protein
MLYGVFEQFLRFGFSKYNCPKFDINFLIVEYIDLGKNLCDFFFKILLNCMECIYTAVKK